MLNCMPGRHCALKSLAFFSFITALEKAAILQDEQLDAVVPKLGDNWKTLATELGFTEEEMAGIEDEQSEIKEQGRAMLMKWKDREGEGATKETLSKALQESGLKDIVESVLEATNGSGS